MSECVVCWVYWSCRVTHLGCPWTVVFDFWFCKSDHCLSNARIKKTQRLSGSISCCMEKCQNPIILVILTGHHGCVAVTRHKATGASDSTELPRSCLLCATFHKQFWGLLIHMACSTVEMQVQLFKWVHQINAKIYRPPVFSVLSEH